MVVTLQTLTGIKCYLYYQKNYIPPFNNQP